MKNMPTMDAPKNKKEGATTGNLMDNQEKILRGEEILYDRNEPKIPTTICIPVELKQRARELAMREGTTMTFMVNLGLKRQVDKGTIWI